MNALHNRNAFEEIGRDAMVQTTTLLPTGGVLTLRKTVQRPGRYLLSDDGAGVDDMRALGLLKITTADTRRGNAIAEQFGLDYSNGVFSARDVSDEQLQAVVVYLAEAVRRWTEAATETEFRNARADLVERVVESLQPVIGRRQYDRDRELAGFSGKRYPFDLVVTLGDDRLAIFQTVSPNPASLASAHLKLFDLKQGHGEWPREVVTERLDAWDNADMVLLSDVATHVRDFAGDWGNLSAVLQPKPS